MTLAKNILVFGATGNIGSFILDAILPERAQFGRIAIFTSPDATGSKASQLDKLRKQGVEVITGNVDNEEAVKAAYEGIDTVISALGRNALAQQIPLIHLAAASKDVKWFLPSEYGTDIKYGPASANEKPHQQKLKVRAYLENEISRQDLAYSYVVTGPFAEWYLRFIPGFDEAGGWDIKARRAVLAGDVGGKISLTAMKDVGIFVRNTLLHATAETRNRALCVNSFTTTPDQIQVEIERQIGGNQPWDTLRTSLERLRQVEDAAWENGNPAATGVTLRRIWAEGGTLYAERANGIIGDPAVMGLEELVKNEIARVAQL